MKKFAFAASALGAMIMAGSAQAATYVGTRAIIDNVGYVSNINLSITTDGTIGTLARSNITDWTVGITARGGSDTLFGPLSGNNSTLFFTLAGYSGLSATATNLLFDFDDDTHVSFFGPGGPGVSQSYYMLAGKSVQGTWLGPTNAELASVHPGNGITIQWSIRGVQTIGVAAAAVAAVPEPASWAMMIAGFGIVGGAMRKTNRRRRSETSLTQDSKRSSIQPPMAVAYGGYWS